MNMPIASSGVTWMTAVLPLIVLLLLCVAAYTDLRHRKISNWISIGLIVSFSLYALGNTGPVDFWRHLKWGSITLGVLLIPFAMGKIGGGDVKLLSAVVLWGGPIMGFEILVLTALIGGGLALIAMSPLVRHVWDWSAMRFGFKEGIFIYPTVESLPYGIAISAAGCFAIMRMFIF